MKYVSEYSLDLQELINRAPKRFWFSSKDLSKTEKLILMGYVLGQSTFGFSVEDYKECGGYSSPDFLRNLVNRINSEYNVVIPLPDEFLTINKQSGKRKIVLGGNREMNTDIECKVYVGQDDEKKTIYIEKRVLKADDKRVATYEKEYRNIQAFAQQNGYVVADVNALVEDDGYARTIDDTRRVERGKAFVEAMSSQARANDELIQQRRNERYEEMIDEYDNSNSMGRSR